MSNQHISIDIWQKYKKSQKSNDKSFELKEIFSHWAQLLKSHLCIEWNPLFLQAFTHRSFQNECVHWNLPNYERLEFLGDSLLQTWVTTKLYENSSESNEKEGKLSVLRSSIVNEKSLSKLSKLLKLDELILLGKGEMVTGGNLKSSLLCDVFESLLGAYFQVVKDYDKTFSFIESLFDQAKEQGLDLYNETNLESFDVKTKLQNIVMKELKAPPVYSTQEIKRGEFQFEVSLYINDQMIMKELTNSVKAAQRSLALKTLKQTNKFSDIKEFLKSI